MLHNKPLQGKYFLEHSINNLSNKSTTKLKVIEKVNVDYQCLLPSSALWRMSYSVYSIENRVIICYSTYEVGLYFVIIHTCPAVSQNCTVHGTLFTDTDTTNKMKGETRLD
jgi:hypothetical protein